jgi:hypothetical protein
MSLFFITVKPAGQGKQSRPVVVLNNEVVWQLFEDQKRGDMRIAPTFEINPGRS